MKKLISALLAAIIVFSLVPVAVCVEAAESAISYISDTLHRNTNWTEGDWTYDEIPSGLKYGISNGKVTITGYTGSATDIIIPSTIGGYPVTSIGQEAFYNCYDLVSIIIPDGVVSIGFVAFNDCISLESIRLSGSLKSIGMYAFEGCTSLESINLPKSVTSIGAYAFYGCTSLESITVENGNTVYHSAGNCIIETAAKTLIAGCKNSVIPSDGSVTTIGSYAFYGCSTLVSITIPESVTSRISGDLFRGCSNLESISVADTNPVYHSEGNCIIETATKTLVAGCKNSVIPSDGSVTKIAYGAFRECSGLESITIPEGVTHISRQAFQYCKNLKSVIIPEGVTYISGYTFDGCSDLLSITLPNSVTSIESYAFSNCSNLESIDLSEKLTSIGNRAFIGCSNLKSISLPDGVTNIDSYAFYDCIRLTQIVIPDSITHIGEGAFGHCSEIRAVYFTGSEQSWSQIKIENNNYFISNENVIFTTTDVPEGLEYEIVNEKVTITGYTGNAAEVVIPAIINECPVTSIGERAFYGCESLRGAIIPEGVKRIGNYAFAECQYLSAVSLPDSVMYISDGAFEYCYSLKHIDLPGDLISIGENAFFGCMEITSITLPDSVTSIDRGAFHNCSGLETVYYGATEKHWANIIISGYNAPLLEADVIFVSEDEYEKSFIPEGLEYEIVDGLVTVTDYTGDAVEIVIPAVIDGCFVTGIGDYAFSNCSELARITIPEFLTSIGDYAFNRCTSLTSINIPSCVNRIGDSAFEGCGLLTAVTIPERVTEINFRTFASCSELRSITVPESVTIIGNDAFYRCEKLKNIILPEGLTELGYAFDNTAYYNDDSNWENGVLYIGNYLMTAKKTLSGSYTLKSNTKLIALGAFSGCTKLTNVNLPDGVKSIGAFAFVNCSNLKTITIPESVTGIYQDAFSGCSSLETVYYEGSPSQWMSMTIYAGTNYDLLEANIIFAKEDPDGYVPEGLVYDIYDGKVTITDYTGNSSILIVPSTIEGCPVMSIGPQAFFDCHKLNSITLPEGVTSIGNSAFYECDFLYIITIPESVTSIGSRAFYGTPYYNYSSNWENGVLYIGNHLIEARESLSGNYTVKPGTKVIAEDAFKYCEKLTGITIPEGVTSIGDDAFYNCTGLTSITLPESVTSIGDYAFCWCENLESIVVPQGVTSIGGYAFDETLYYNDNSNWEDDVLYIGNYLIRARESLSGNYTVKPDTKIIAGNAFQYCEKLTGVTIPDGVTSIGDRAFDMCTSIESIAIPKSVTSIGEEPFTFCHVLEGITVEDENTVYHSAGNCLIETETKTLIAGGKSCVIPSDGSVTSIGNSAFGGRCSLESLVIPDGVTHIGNEAFQSTNIKSLIIPDRVTSIGDRAFSMCNNLASIKIPEGVTKIKENTFLYCEKLKNITLPETLTSIDDGAFSHCKSLEGIVIPKGVTSIGNGAFSGCSSLTSMIIPEGVTNIGAFFGCTRLESIVIPNSVTSINWEGFYNCQKLKTVYYKGTAEQWSHVSVHGNNEDLLEASFIFAGDANCDGSTNAADSLLVHKLITGDVFVEANALSFWITDLNGDGKVNTKDSYILKKMLSE